MLAFLYFRAQNPSVCLVTRDSEEWNYDYLKTPNIGLIGEKLLWFGHFVQITTLESSAFGSGTFNILKSVPLNQDGITVILQAISLWRLWSIELIGVPSPQAFNFIFLRRRSCHATLNEYSPRF